ncbi:bifunctional phosphoribosyl-AMP cyclohydrolase/phosphoribosyl-ATP diphosphatase HisIE [Flavobacterium haoranii]|uniref:bifunctional phosphoribosyl-AMP cyclohydrolase/phosphoribosyl-ATP diphosphatase HisIE n=1 Tax=Flavobacterium haoranii TaxID=683124 RepID=UPI001D0EFFFE|nr:bifunctional phosphoribosyl-AMP cyclohydrolase/phosphoribosyl-ATP diphosphatase HisIE [Flavobacterium haoranii]
MINFSKYTDGLVPAIVQDNETKNVLMLGFMNQEALEKTFATNKVTFFSRSKNRLWTKGEESGNFLNLVSYSVDCDNDTLLLKVNPVGTTCHTGSDTCWNENNKQDYGFLTKLENTIKERKESATAEKSYVASLLRKELIKLHKKLAKKLLKLLLKLKTTMTICF